MITCPAGACWTSPATWMSTSGQSSVSTVSVTLTDAIAQYAGRVCTGTSPSRAHGLTARTAARRSSAGERRERVPAPSVNAVVHSAIHLLDLLQRFRRFSLLVYLAGICNSPTLLVEQNRRSVNSMLCLEGHGAPHLNA